jgi:hypothetical protein
MEINPTFVTFQQAKYLKEIGFDNIECSAYYHIDNGYKLGYSLCYSNVNKQDEGVLLAPEQWQFIEWMRVKKIDSLLETKTNNSIKYKVGDKLVASDFDKELYGIEWVSITSINKETGVYHWETDFNGGKMVSGYFFKEVDNKE